MKEPTIEEFVAGLGKMGTPSDRFMKMLRSHYNSTNRTSTARMLSQKAGYKDHRGFNLRYGLFARDLGRAMGVKAGTDIGLLVEFASPGKLSNREFLVFMKERFAMALRRARWV